MDDIPFRPITNYNFKYQKCNNIPFQNILKRQLLLDEYINQQKIDINNNNNKIKDKNNKKIEEKKYDKRNCITINYIPVNPSLFNNQK